MISRGAGCSCRSEGIGCKGTRGGVGQWVRGGCSWPFGYGEGCSVRGNRGGGYRSSDDGLERGDIDRKHEVGLHYSITYTLSNQRVRREGYIGKLVNWASGLTVYHL